MECCEWAKVSETMQSYHNLEWGRPVHEDQKLFEALSLEIFQAGLSWAIVLKKRAALTSGFFDWSIQKVADMQPTDVEELMQNPAVIRYRKKIEAIIHNAQCLLVLQAEYGTFDQYIWSFVDQQPIVHAIVTPADVPSETALSQEISRNLKARGFQFVGSKTVYAFMQAIGLVNDHEDNCHLKQRT
jgi:DNA-3-methyladenine glycosylase I